MPPNGSPLDSFIPRPDVRERFEITIHAPADLVMDVARGFDMQSIALVRAIFRLREWLMGVADVTARTPQGLLAETQALGWRKLAEESGRLVVCGARCQPWLANVAFTGIAPGEFAADSTPEHVRIAWSLEAKPLGPALTRFGQETRVVANDEPARRRFRRYWRWARFGIIGIRVLLLPAVRRAAERHWAASGPRT